MKVISSYILFLHIFVGIACFSTDKVPTVVMEFAKETEDSFQITCETQESPAWDSSFMLVPENFKELISSSQTCYEYNGCKKIVDSANQQPRKYYNKGPILDYRWSGLELKTEGIHPTDCVSTTAFYFSVLSKSDVTMRIKLIKGKTPETNCLSENLEGTEVEFGFKMKYDRLSWQHFTGCISEETGNFILFDISKRITECSPNSFAIKDVTFESDDSDSGFIWKMHQSEIWNVDKLTIRKKKSSDLPELISNKQEYIAVYYAYSKSTCDIFLNTDKGEKLVCNIKANIWTPCEIELTDKFLEATSITFETQNCEYRYTFVDAIHILKTKSRYGFKNKNSEAACFLPNFNVRIEPYKPEKDECMEKGEGSIYHYFSNGVRTCTSEPRTNWVLAGVFIGIGLLILLVGGFLVYKFFIKKRCKKEDYKSNQPLRSNSPS